MPSATSRAPCSFLSATATAAPSSAKDSAIPRPMPLAAPVTIATRPSSFPMARPGCGRWAPRTAPAVQGSICELRLREVLESHVVRGVVRPPVDVAPDGERRVRPDDEDPRSLADVDLLGLPVQRDPLRKIHHVQAVLDQLVDLGVLVVRVVDVGLAVEVEVVRVAGVRVPRRICVEDHRLATLRDVVVEGAGG